MVLGRFTVPAGGASGVWGILSKRAVEQGLVCSRNTGERHGTWEDGRLGHLITGVMVDTCQKSQRRTADSEQLPKSLLTSVPV